ncbi:hypothetical protein CPC08DRAFT_769589 [Agrocybe pediades]|nr:hypothetical protein CPC08DRAFT_769589 [Agrocybe pediades]
MPTRTPAPLAPATVSARSLRPPTSPRTGYGVAISSVTVNARDSWIGISTSASSARTRTYRFAKSPSAHPCNFDVLNKRTTQTPPFAEYRAWIEPIEKVERGGAHAKLVASSCAVAGEDVGVAHYVDEREDEQRSLSPLLSGMGVSGRRSRSRSNTGTLLAKTLKSIQHNTETPEDEEGDDEGNLQWRWMLHWPQRCPLKNKSELSTFWNQHSLRLPHQSRQPEEQSEPVTTLTPAPAPSRAEVKFTINGPPPAHQLGFDSAMLSGQSSTSTNYTDSVPRLHPPLTGSKRA